MTITFSIKFTDISFNTKQYMMQCVIQTTGKTPEKNKNKIINKKNSTENSFILAQCIFNNDYKVCNKIL